MALAAFVIGYVVGRKQSNRAKCRSYDWSRATPSDGEIFQDLYFD